MSHPFTLTLSCRERPGIVSAVSSFLFRHDCDIVEHQQFPSRLDPGQGTRPRDPPPGRRYARDGMRVIRDHADLRIMPTWVR